LADATVLGTSLSLQSFLDAANSLIERGACAITSTCGFLIRHQDALARALSVPVSVSSLSHFQALATAHTHVAILTINARAIDAAARIAAKLPTDAAILDLPESSHFAQAILHDRGELDVDTARTEWVELALRAKRDHPQIRAWLFECANMPVYSEAVAQATGLPVYDTLTHGIALHAKASAARSP
jgi:hypothetical protein